MDDILRRAFEEDCSDEQCRILLDIAGLKYDEAYESWQHQYKFDMLLNPRFRLAKIETVQPLRLADNTNDKFYNIYATCHPEYLDEKDMRLMRKVKSGLYAERQQGGLTVWTGYIHLTVDFSTDPLTTEEYFKIYEYMQKICTPSC